MGGSLLYELVVAALRAHGIRMRLEEESCKTEDVAKLIFGRTWVECGPDVMVRDFVRDFLKEGFVTVWQLDVGKNVLTEGRREFFIRAHVSYF